MRNLDFTPLWRSTVGFDRLFDLAEAAQHAAEETYPPYNIERLADDRYAISLALAGFAPSEITITAEQNVLTVEGAKPAGQEREYLYRGISSRPFKRQFSLADYVQVKGAGGTTIRSDCEAGKWCSPKRSCPYAGTTRIRFEGFAAA